MIKSIFFFFYIGLVLLSTHSFASKTGEGTQSIEQQAISPYTLVKVTGERLFDRLEQNSDRTAQTSSWMERVVVEELMPVVDYKYISYKILGTHLPKSTKAQRKAFVAAMKANIIRSYASILQQYQGQEVIYPKQKPLKNKRLVAIPIELVAQGKPSIKLLFKLRKNKKSGNWLIFDVLAEGISMLATKQAEVSKRIRKYGLQQVTTELRGS